MCLIIVKKKGVEMPTKEFLSDVWEVNPHGAGIMWKNGHTHQVHFIKGFMKEEDLMLALDKLDFKVNDEVAIHLRWATSGKIDAQTCHPFISSKQKKMREVTVERNTGKTLFMHNGVIDDLNDKKTVSDTQRFARWYLPEFPLKKLYESKQMQKMLTKFVDNSRLCIMNAKHGMLLTGDWINGDNGLLLSKKFIKKDPRPWASNDFDWGFDRGTLFTQESLCEETIYNCEGCTTEGRFDEVNQIEGSVVCRDCEWWVVEPYITEHLPDEYNETELDTVLSWARGQYKLCDATVKTIKDMYTKGMVDEVQ